MGLLDKFKSIYGKQKKKTAKPKHAVKPGGKDDLKKQFMSVGSADDAPKEKSDDKKVKSSDKKTERKKKSSDKVPTFAPRVLMRPLITEKMSMIPGRYAFEVHNTANRHMVRRAVNDLYGVLPVKVNIMQMRGKAVRYGRNSGFTKGWKKAVVTLPEGKTIEVFET